VVQYRGQIMPLINVGQVLHGNPADPALDEKHQTVQIVVYMHQGSNVGLLVERILDVVEERIDMQKTATRSGVLGLPSSRKR